MFPESIFSFNCSTESNQFVGRDERRLRWRPFLRHTQTPLCQLRQLLNTLRVSIFERKNGWTPETILIKILVRAIDWVWYANPIVISLWTNEESAIMEWEQGHSRIIGYSKIKPYLTLRDTPSCPQVWLYSQSLQSREMSNSSYSSLGAAQVATCWTSILASLSHYFISATRRLCWLCKPAQPGAQKVGEKRWDKRQQTSESYLSILQDLSSLSWWLVRVGWESQHWLTGDKQKTTLVMNLTVFLIFNLVMRLIKLRAG